MRRKEICEDNFIPRPSPSNNVPVSLAEYSQLTGLNASHGLPEAKAGVALSQVQLGH